MFGMREDRGILFSFSHFLLASKSESNPSRKLKIVTGGCRPSDGDKDETPSGIDDGKVSSLPRKANHCVAEVKSRHDSL